MIENKTNARSQSIRSIKQLSPATQTGINKSPVLGAAARLRGRAVIFSALIMVVFAFSLSITIYGSGNNGYNFARTNFLRTSYNPDHYSLFQIDGDTIYARGKYADDRIKKVFIPYYEDRITSYKMSIESDGSYEAEITCPTTMEQEYIAVELTSGAVMSYMMYYDNGWYFPDNGLSVTNKKVFENITNAPPESVGFYISETADAHEISVVQEQIKLISDSVVDGIESDYEKARALCRYVADHFYYDLDARATSVTERNVVLASVLKTSRTICIGFADLYCALLQAQGIDAVNIIGGSSGGDVDYEHLTDGIQNHEFTAFFYEEEDRWVWVDSCWCGSGDYKNGEFLEKTTHEKYFDISDEALSLNHRADYAQRRNFFKAKASAITSTKKTEPEPSETVSSSVTTVSAETTTAVSDDFAEEETETPVQKEDDTVLYVIAGVLGAGVLVVLLVLVNITRKKP